MKIAIVEDESVHSSLLETYIQKWSMNKQISVDIESYLSAEKFLFQWEEKADYDLLFLDIQMPGMNGVQLAHKIREKNSNVVIVFTTGIADYLQEGYEVEALQYLVKPIKEEMVCKCLEKTITKRPPEAFLVFHTEEEIVKIAENNINYVEASGHGSIIGISYKEMLLVKESLYELERMLDSQQFIKCHRSYICRLGNIHRIDRDNVYFDDGSQIPVSRRLYKEVNQAFIRYYTKKG